MAQLLGPTLTFIALCLVARFSYSVNDVFIGRLARRHGGVEVAALRGVSLGVSVAPWLLAVPAAAWQALAAHGGVLLVTVAITSVAKHSAAACGALPALWAARRSDAVHHGDG